MEKKTEINRNKKSLLKQKFQKIIDENPNDFTIEINTTEFAILWIIKKKNIDYLVVIILEIKKNQIFEKKFENLKNRPNNY